MEPDRHPAFAWKLTPHVCSACFGRVLEHSGRDAGSRYLCADCGAAGDAVHGTDHPPICACAIRFGQRDARIRCMPNPRRRLELPFEVVAAEAT